MAEFMVLMKSAGQPTGDWTAYVEKLRASDSFRGGSSLGSGIALANKAEAGAPTVTGFMRFEAETIADVRGLLEGNPLYEAGGEIEILELLPD